MTTVGEIIDRTYTDILHPAGVNLPPFDILTSNPLSDSASTMTVSGLQTYVPQTIVEIDSELILTKEAESGTTIDLNERGFRESAAAQHVSGTKVWIDPEFPRITVFNAIVAVVKSLPGKGLNRIQEQETTIDGLSDVTLTSGALDVVGILYEESANDSRLLAPTDYDILPYSTPKVKFRAGRQGADATIFYLSNFTTPDTEARDLTTYCGVPDSLVDDIPIAVGARLLLGKDVPQTYIEEVQEQSEQEQVGTALSISDVLERKFEARIAEEKRVLRQRFKAVWA